MNTLTLQPAARTVAAPQIRLAALDIDGTLLTTRKELKSATARAVFETVAAGVKVVLATARPPRTTRAIHQALQLDTLSIHYNGALVWDFARRKQVFHYPMDPRLVRRMIHLARRHDPNCAVQIDILDKCYSDGIGAVADTAGIPEPDAVGPLEAFLTVPVTRLSLLPRPAAFDSLRQAVGAKFGQAVILGTAASRVIQVLDQNVDKVVALRRVTQHYGIEPSQVLAIGDGANDAGMLRWAGLGVAVANAHPRALRSAARIVPSNDHLGVAHALRKHLLVNLEV